MTIWPVANKFFVAGGTATADTRKGAMQKALKNAGIQHCNLVPVSSVLNPYAEQLEGVPEIPHAAIAYCVLAEQEGAEGETIAAGVGWCYMRGRDGSLKAYVVEDEGKKEERAVRGAILHSLVEMAEAEKLQICDQKNEKTLLGRHEWLKQQRQKGREFRGWRSPERAYARYVGQQSASFFRTEIRGIDVVDDDWGYAVAALVYVFD